jgi:hypothetical protein
MKVLLVAGGQDYPSHKTVAEPWASRWVVEHTRLELRCSPDWAGYDDAAESRRNRMMLALLSKFSVAGDEVKVVAFPAGSDAADLLHEARNWPFVVREIEG